MHELERETPFEQHARRVERDVRTRGDISRRDAGRLRGADRREDSHVARGHRGLEEQRRKCEGVDLAIRLWSLLTASSHARTLR